MHIELVLIYFNKKKKTFLGDFDIFLLKIIFTIAKILNLGNKYVKNVLTLLCLNQLNITFECACIFQHFLLNILINMFPEIFPLKFCVFRSFVILMQLPSLSDDLGESLKHLELNLCA